MSNLSKKSRKTKSNTWAEQEVNEPTLSRREQMKSNREKSDDKKPSAVDKKSKSLVPNPSNKKSVNQSINTITPVKQDEDEAILRDENNRQVLFPIKYHDMYRMYKQHVASFWTNDELDLSQDHKDWISLNPHEQHFIKMVLAFFAASDGIVIENLVSRFTEEVKVAEARAFQGFQTAMENIHSETYSLLIDTYIKDEEEKMKLFNAMNEQESIRLKADWAIKYINSDQRFAVRLVAQTCVEGIFFSGSFCAIFWLKKRGLMPGLTFSNELISRDEGLHTDFGCLIYSHLKHKLTEFEVQEIVKDALVIEKKFINESLDCALIGMNANLMSQYLEFVADRLIQALGQKKLYNTKNPFDWMDMISLEGKTNFFEKRVGDYQKAGVMNSIKNNKEIDFNEDF